MLAFVTRFVKHGYHTYLGGCTMIVMFSARRLKAGAWEQFWRAWDPGESKPPGFQRAYHAKYPRRGRDHLVRVVRHE
jgi:hypothetical protein